MTHPHLWITPPLEGPISGGTLWNRRTLAGLAARRVTVEQRTLREAFTLDPARHPVWWLDSLYLDAVSDLHGRRAGRPLWLLLHYLPSLLQDQQGQPAAELCEQEVTALTRVSGVVTTSALMADLARERGARRVCVVEPGVDPGARARPELGEPVRAVMLANLTRNKGTLCLLEGLARQVTAGDRFTLTVVGDLEREPGYAQRCRDLCVASHWLRDRVRFAGALTPEEARALLSVSDLFVSASVFEAYGMALAEARAVGVPILALAGGNACAHVHADTGGELFDSHAALAAGLLALTRELEELAARKRRAIVGRRARGWDAAADELLSVFGSAVKP